VQLYVPDISGVPCICYMSWSLRWCTELGSFTAKESSFIRHLLSKIYLTKHGLSPYVLLCWPIAISSLSCPIWYRHKLTEGDLKLQTLNYVLFRYCASKLFTSRVRKHN